LVGSLYVRASGRGRARAKKRFFGGGGGGGVFQALPGGTASLSRECLQGEKMRRRKRAV